jgi:hypothetical protein
MSQLITKFKPNIFATAWRPRRQYLLQVDSTSFILLVKIVVVIISISIAMIIFCGKALLLRCYFNLCRHKKILFPTSAACLLFSKPE